VNWKTVKQREIRWWCSMGRKMQVPVQGLMNVFVCANLKNRGGQGQGEDAQGEA
jgi:hypothetical protein